MAGRTPIYEQFSRQGQGIRSVQPIQQSSPVHHQQQNKHSISIISSAPIEQYPEYTHSHPPQYPQPLYVHQSSNCSQKEEQQHSYYQDRQQTPTRSPRRHADLKHTRSQSHAQGSPIYPLRRKEVDDVTPKRAQSVLYPQHIRVSRGSDTSEGSSGNESHITADTSVSVFPPQQTVMPQRKPMAQNQGYSHHAAVRGAVGYAPEEPADDVVAFSKKIVVVGDGGSGKTSLLMRYKDRVFPEGYTPTVFENYITNKKHRGTGKTVEVALWDTAGQEEYDRLRPLSYPETSVILICFAIDCPQSLENIKEKWAPEVLHFCPDTPVLLVACKSDLRDNDSCRDLLAGEGLRAITKEQGRAMAAHIKAKAYIECSSKAMRNVDEIFEAAIDISVAHETGGDWSRGQVAQDLEKGRLGPASQLLDTQQASGRGLAAGGFGPGAGRTANGIKKKKKSRACRIL